MREALPLCGGVVTLGCPGIVVSAEKLREQGIPANVPARQRDQLSPITPVTY